MPVLHRRPRSAGKPFLARTAKVDVEARDFFWNGKDLPAGLLVPAPPSGFLTGIWVEDPAGQKTEKEPDKVKRREFNDLKRRLDDLRGLVEVGRPYELSRGVLRAEHY